MKFTIPIEPRTKKNSMRPRLTRDKRFLGMMQSEVYCQYEKDALKLIPGSARKNISAPVNVKALYYMKTRRKVDKTNLESALLDVLVKAGVLADDNSLIVISTDGSRVLYDKENPRTCVEITEVDE